MFRKLMNSTGKVRKMLKGVLEILKGFEEAVEEFMSFLVLMEF